MAKAIHSMIRVLDIDRAIEFYGEAFGLQIAGAGFDFNDFIHLVIRRTISR